MIRLRSPRRRDIEMLGPMKDTSRVSARAEENSRQLYSQYLHSYSAREELLSPFGDVIARPYSCESAAISRSIYITLRQLSPVS